MAEFKEYKGYKVYNTGVVISPNGKQIGSQTPNGYIRITISGEKTSIHQLIMKLFVGESNGLDIDHKNGIKNDNRLENLEYVTRKENIKRAWSNGLVKARYGNEMHTTKISDEIIEAVKKDTDSQRLIAEKYNISRGSVNRIKNNKQRKCSVK